MWTMQILREQHNTHCQLTSVLLYTRLKVCLNNLNYCETELWECSDLKKKKKIAMAKDIWVEADWPSGHRFGRGKIHGTPASPVLFFINRTSIGCGPSNWSMAARIWVGGTEHPQLNTINAWLNTIQIATVKHFSDFSIYICLCDVDRKTTKHDSLAFLFIGWVSPVVMLRVITVRVVTIIRTAAATPLPTSLQV